MSNNRGRISEMAVGIETAELNALFAEGRKHQFNAGEHLITEGEPCNFVFEILDGTVALARNGKDGRCQILSFIGPRQFLGFATTPNYPNLATALTPVTAICYPRSDLEKALLSSPKFSLEFQIALTRILESAHDHVYTIGQRSAIERVASFLLYLRANQANFSQDGAQKKGEHVVLPMTRLDIAHFLGLTIETISRVFSTLKQSGILSFNDSDSCEILNIQKIQSLGGCEDFTQHPGSA